jgi:hypothetical protein
LVPAGIVNVLGVDSGAVFEATRTGVLSAARLFTGAVDAVSSAWANNIPENKNNVHSARIAYLR